MAFYMSLAVYHNKYYCQTTKKPANPKEGKREPLRRGTSFERESYSVASDSAVVGGVSGFVDAQLAKDNTTKKIGKIQSRRFMR